jgi:spore maturation protein SpmA/spore maturation protein SpmB
MTLSYIWSGFFLVGFAAALVQWFFMGDVEVFKRIVDGIFSTSKFAFMDVALPLAGVMTFMLGLLNVGEKAGAVDVIAKLIGPFFSRIFPEIPRNHPATGHMVMNFSANFLGLDNAATPFGLKAMESMQTLNPNKDEPSNAQIMFLVLHTSGLTFIPISIIAQRAVLGAADPSDVFLPILIATYAATMTALISVSIKQRINLFDRVIVAWIGSITAVIGGMLWYMTQYMTRNDIEIFSKLASNIALATIIGAFLIGALRKRVNVFDAFVEGAKGGIKTTVTIVPYLVGMLVAISVLRNSGVLNFVVSGFTWFFSQLGMNSDFTPALPTALMKPISGSGARGMMIDAMKTYGADSFVGRLACVLQGSTDTTFYIVALYFGAVGIKRTRYAIGYGLITDLGGVLASVWIAYLFFH